MHGWSKEMSNAKPVRPGDWKKTERRALKRKIKRQKGKLKKQLKSFPSAAGDGGAAVSWGEDGPRTVELWEAYVFRYCDEQAGRIRAACDVLRMLREVPCDAEDQRLARYAHAETVWQLLAAEIGAWLLKIAPLDLVAPDIPQQVQLRGLARLAVLAGTPLHREALTPSSLLLPRPLLEELEHSLCALREGEVRPLLEPARSGRHSRPWSHDQMKHRAVEHVMFLAGQGITKQIALRRVAAATKIAIETLREWEVEASNWRKSEARAAGELSQKFVADPEYGRRAGDAVDASVLSLLESLTKAEPLAEFGRRYAEEFAGKAGRGRSAASRYDEGGAE